jgi:eukaryotic-like serine/threonine-protein kinase
LGLHVARHTADLDGLVGCSLGRRRYEVVARIARGGMAVVYRGHDRQLDRVVAIKVPRPELARDRGFSEQFRREARAAARLSHPNVVAVYDSGEDRGLPWIVMEHVSGQTLRHLLDARGRLDPATTAELLGPVADALDHAHENGIAHLDVKPENVLLSGDTVKVADFGLVRAAAQGSRQRALAATIPYCAPEVLRGGLVDGRADIYALGVVAWECLVGRPPFEGDQEQVIQQHLRGRIPPPSRRLEGVPPAVDAAVWRATDPDPDRRFMRASDFGAAIGAPRRRRIDQALQATAELPAAVRDTSVQLPALAAGSLATTVDRLPPAPPAALRPRPTTGRVPKTRPRTRRRGRLRNALLLLGLLAIAVVAGAAGYLGSSVSMPDVTGRDVGQARVILAAHGLRSRVGAAVASSSVRKGLVARQSVAAGSSVRRRTVVLLRPSLGIQLANLAGQQATEVEATLTRLGFHPAETRETSLTVPAGEVKRTDPAPGTLLTDGQQVTVVVSAGRPKVAVPDVAGRSYADARGVLAAAHLGASRRLAFDGQVPAGLVVRTEPPAGGRATWGSAVTVVVSKGPDLVLVPDVRGLPKQEAAARLQAAGLRPQFDFLGIGSRVIRQSAAPGSKAERGSTVHLLLNPF